MVVSKITSGFMAFIMMFYVALTGNQDFMKIQIGLYNQKEYNIKGEVKFNLELENIANFYYEKSLENYEKEKETYDEVFKSGQKGEAVIDLYMPEPKKPDKEEIRKTVNLFFKELVISYDGKVNVKDKTNPEFDIKVGYIKDGYAEPELFNLILKDKSLYIDSQSIPKFAKIVYDCMESYYKSRDMENRLEESQKELNEFISKMNEQLKNKEYILLADLTEQLESFNEQNNEINETDVMAISNIIAKHTSGYETKLITKNENGFTVELKAENIVDELDSLLNYILKDREGLEKDILEIYKILEKNKATESEYYESEYYIEEEPMTKEKVKEELDKSVSEFKDFVNEYRGLNQGEPQYSEEVKTLKESKGSNYIYQISLKDDVYKVNCNLLTVIKGNKLGNFNVNYTVSKLTEDIKAPEGKIINLEELKQYD